MVCTGSNLPLICLYPLHISNVKSVSVCAVRLRSKGGKLDLYCCDPEMKLHEPCETVRLCEGETAGGGGELSFTVETLVYSHRPTRLILHRCCSSGILLG